MNDEQVVLRPSLLPGLLKALARQCRAPARKRCACLKSAASFPREQPEEFTHLALVLSGPTAERTWRAGEGSEADLFHLKGIVAAALGADDDVRARRRIPRSRFRW